MALALPGRQPGKLLADPAVWFPVRAQLEGLDPWSPSPHEQLKYYVFQRKLSIEAAALKAQIVPMLNPEKAVEAVTDYLKMQLPEPPELEEIRIRTKEAQMEEIANMAPIPISSIKIGTRIGGDPATTTLRPPSLPPAIRTFGAGGA